MSEPLIAVVGDVSPGRALTPGGIDPVSGSAAAEELGRELAKRGARLLVYGGPYAEADAVRGYVAAGPKADRCIVKWFSHGHAPPPFAEEATRPRLFDERIEKGPNWEVGFYRSLVRADAVIVIGGGNATMISGQVAVGAGIPILALHRFGGGGALVWETLYAGDDLPTRDEIDAMAQPWTEGSAQRLVAILYAQIARRSAAAPLRVWQLYFASGLFIAALSLAPVLWGGNDVHIWGLLLGPTLTGIVGAVVRSRPGQAGEPIGPPAMTFAQLVPLGAIAGGVAALLFITAQLTANPEIATAQLSAYGSRSLPFALVVGFVAGLGSNALFAKLVSVDVANTKGIGNA